MLDHNIFCSNWNVQPCEYCQPCNEGDEASLCLVACQIGRQPRPKQEEAILHFISGNDIFISLPTGSRKFATWCLQQSTQIAELISVITVPSLLVH